MLRSFGLENNHENLQEKGDNPFDYFLSTTAWLLCGTYHTTLQATPCQILFGTDMIHNIIFRADWDQIQKSIKKSNQNKNKSQTPHEFEFVPIFKGNNLRSRVTCQPLL
jgi:hypothetical protein